MEYLKLLKEYETEMFDALGKLISFKSVKDKPVRGRDGSIYPFGVGVQEAYEYILGLGASMGFKTVNHDNYGGHIEFSDENSEGVFGIAGHIDVMPEGSGWTQPCWELTEKEGLLYGRGVMDDKGPVIACLYAMKALRDAGVRPARKVRLIVGLDEETGKSGMLHYLEKAGQPDMGITPDGDFPMTNGEMGIIDFELARRFTRASREGLRLTKLTGGTAFNAVPGECRAVIVSSSKDDYEKIKSLANQFRSETDYMLSCKKQGSSIAITATGRAGHGAYPELSLNAVSVMMKFLGELSFANDEVNDLIDFYNSHIGFNVFGENIGCGFRDEESGVLKFNVGVVEWNEDMASIKVNIRIPVSYTAEEVYAGIESCTDGTGIGIIKESCDRSCFVNLNHPMVQTLMKAYVDVTGDEETRPEVSPGGTYAKLLNNTIAFGPLLPGDPDTIHQADERMKKSSFITMTEIYARAIAGVIGE